VIYVYSVRTPFYGFFSIYAAIIKSATPRVVPIIIVISPRHGPRRQHRSFSYANRFRWNVFTEPFPKSDRLFLRICCLTSNVLFLFGGRCLETNVVSEPFDNNGCFSSSSCHFLLLRSRYFPQHPGSKPPPSVFFP
jgi:hypothetical protein